MWDLDRFSNSLAVVTDDDECYSFADLRRATDDLAEEFSTRSLVFCLCENALGSLLGYIAAISNRTVPLLLDAKIDPGFLERLIGLYKPAYLWIPNRLLPRFPHFAVSRQRSDYSLLRDRGTCASEMLHPDLALLLPTSGTTGSKKLVRLSYRNLRENTRSIVQYLRVESNQKAITSLPMFYSYGLSVINAQLYAGGSLMLTTASVLQKEFWGKMRSNKIASISGVPYTYELLDRVGLTGMDLPDLQVLTQAGGKLSERLNEKFARYAQETGREFFVMYGQTEASPRISYLPPIQALSKLGSIGIPIPNGKLVLVDDVREEIRETGVAGELRYEGPNVSMGYAEELVDLAKGDEWQGVLFTGDVAKMDEDGYFYIVGRKKRFIKLFGSRINLDEVEDLLRDGFPQVDFACIGNDNSLRVFATDSSIMAEVGAMLRMKLSFQPNSFSFTAIEDLPKGGSGKTSYAMLSELYDE
jgi:long-chain acyl-CoA synthetase